MITLGRPYYSYKSILDECDHPWKTIFLLEIHSFNALASIMYALAFLYLGFFALWLMLWLTCTLVLLLWWLVLWLFCTLAVALDLCAGLWYCSGCLLITSCLLSYHLLMFYIMKDFSLVDIGSTNLNWCMVLVFKQSIRI